MNLLKNYSYFFFIYLLFLKIILGQSMSKNLETIMPDQVQNWEIKQEDQKYDKENLYEYIDGGAELFLSYGFQDVLNRTYIKPDQPDIVVDIFDMGKSYNAYGVFSYSKENEDSTFGQGSQYVPGLLLFWKYRFYISILFSPETEESKHTAFQIARHIESSISSEGPIPQIINLLPEESMLKSSIRYFRHYIWMNTYQFIANDNILNINDSTDAVMAKYEYGDDKLLLLLIQYQNKSECEAAKATFIDGYLKELSENAIAQKDNKWVGYFMHNTVFAVVFNGKNNEEVANLLNQVRQRL